MRNQDTDFHQRMLRMSTKSCFFCAVGAIAAFLALSAQLVVASTDMRLVDNHLSGSEELLLRQGGEERRISLADLRSWVLGPLKVAPDIIDQATLMFGAGGLRVSTGVRNAIIGTVRQDGSKGMSFPTGVTGYGRLDSDGNQAFGMFGRADCYSYGVCTNEFDTFNYKSPPPDAFPPKRTFGIRNVVPITLTVAAAGTYQSLIGVQIAPGGGAPNSYLAGLYMNPGAASKFGVFVDADRQRGPTTSALLKNLGNTSRNVNLLLQTTGPTDPAASFIAATDKDGNGRFKVSAEGTVEFAGKIKPVGKVPHLSNCGLSAAISGTDTAGLVEEGGAAPGCTIAFAMPYERTPYCVVTSQDGAVPISYSLSAIAITITHVTHLGVNGTKINYHCIAP